MMMGSMMAEMEEDYSELAEMDMDDMMRAEMVQPDGQHQMYKKVDYRYKYRVKVSVW